MDYGKDYAGDARALMAGARSTAPIAKDSMAMAISTFEKEIERVAALANSLGALADRLGGSRPTEAGNGEAESPPHSMIDDLHRKRRRLSNLLSLCENERDRIAQALS